MSTPAIPPASNTPAAPPASGTPAIVTSAPKRSRAPEVIALLLVILGGIALPVGLVGGILAALNSGGNGPGGYIALFIGGIVAIVIGFIIGLVSLIRGPHRILSAFPVILPLVPVITVIAAVSSARH